MNTNCVKKGLFLALIAIQILLIPAVHAETLNVRAYATDTVAGYPSSLRTSLISPNQIVRFVVEKPDGEVVQIPAQADLEGVAKTDFFGHQTKAAGKYRVSVVFPGSPDSSPQSPFSVFPDQVSATQSTIRITEQMTAANGQGVFLVVTLFDAYQNPIADHQVKLISSRSEDLIDSLQNGVTDLNGRANFKIRSKYPGVSVFTAMDATLNQVLEDRAELVFYESAASGAKAALFGGLKADIGQGAPAPLSGPVDHFDIEGLPASARVNQELTMTVTAKDKNSNAAKNYTGTILISVPDDENATLPANGEYTFKDSDQGRFTFSLALLFSKAGRQSVQVLDKTNFRIAGEKAVEVVSGSDEPGPVSKTLNIKSPADGAELGSRLILLSGQGLANINLKVFMDDAKIGDSETDSDGFFTYEAKEMEDGAHAFYVMSDAGDVSNTVSVTVDTLPPVLNSFEIFPEGTVRPGEPLTVTLTSEIQLSSVKIRLQGAEQDLPESAGEAGKYSGSIAAPAADGSFPVEVVLVDSLGNKANIPARGTVTVLTPKPVPPPKVEGLESMPGDALIRLKWIAAAKTENPIQNYKVYYGTAFGVLDQKVSTPDSEPSFELRNLANGTQYFVAVKAADSKGLESEEASVTIAATPIAPIPVASSSLRVMPYDSAAELSWDEFQGIQAYYYKIFIGTEPGIYTDYAVTRDPSLSYTVKDLMNGVTYYFSVAALDLSGNAISGYSPEASAVPSGSGFHSSAPDIVSEDTPVNPIPGQSRTPVTGPESIYVLLTSMLFAHFLYHHKKRVVGKMTH